MVSLRALLLMLIALAGCGPSEPPRTAGATPAANTPSGARMPRVAILVFGSRAAGSAIAPTSPVAMVRNRLTELGHKDGKTILIEEHYADGDPQRLPRLAKEIVEGKPDIIVTIAAAATLAARQATSTIPIVMAHAGNPVEAGLIADLARPVGNVTGTTSMVPDLGLKQIEILRELIPTLSRLAVLANPTNPGTAPLLANVNEAARRYDVSVAVADVASPEDFDGALAKLRDARPDALLVMIEPMTFLNRSKILDFARTNRVPTSFDVGREIVVRDGGLISYGPVLSAHYSLVADYVDKILKGARPGDLPVQQPTQFALVVNLKTAATLGIAVPRSLLARADEVIQ